MIPTTRPLFFPPSFTLPRFSTLSFHFSLGRRHSKLPWNVRWLQTPLRATGHPLIDLLSCVFHPLRATNPLAACPMSYHSDDPWNGRRRHVDASRVLFFVIGLCVWSLRRGLVSRSEGCERFGLKIDNGVWTAGFGEDFWKNDFWGVWSCFNF